MSLIPSPVLAGRQEPGANGLSYTIAKWKSRIGSRCILFTGKELSFVPIGHTVKNGEMQLVTDYYGTFGSAYKEALEDMLVFDVVIGNMESHFGNFVFLRLQRPIS